METVPVYILAGGKSLRFGADKARAIADGQPLIVRLARALQSVASRITVVADQPDKYSDLGLETIADVVAERGPLGGLLTALKHNKEEWLFAISCDCVAAKVSWVQTLLSARQNGVNAIAFKDERWEPLFALYHTALAPVVEARLARGELALWSLLEEVKALGVALPADWPTVAQVNTPADLESFSASQQKSEE